MPVRAQSSRIAVALASAYLNYGYSASPQRLSQDVDVRRVYKQTTKKAISEFPIFDHAAFVAGSVKVFIMQMPEIASEDGVTRDRFFVKYPIQVGLAAQPKTTDVADIDPLMLLSQDLRDFCLRDDVVPLLVGLGIHETVVEPPQILCDPDYDALQTDKLFLSVFIVEFEGARSR